MYIIAVLMLRLLKIFRISHQTTAELQSEDKLSPGAMLISIREQLTRAGHTPATDALCAGEEGTAPQGNAEEFIAFDPLIIFIRRIVQEDSSYSKCKASQLQACRAATVAQSAELA